MERPSHTITTLQSHQGPRRVAVLGLSFMVQSLFVLAFVGGIAVQVGKNIQPFELTPFKTVKPESPPPPMPKLPEVRQPSAIMPDFVIDEPTFAGRAPITSQQPPMVTVTPPVTRQPPVNPVPDRPATAIAATHTRPPYPTLARRLGAEGTVTLRLTVLPDGSVGGAQIVTSSGRQDLDQAAQQWIAQHWTYKPAIVNGALVSSQVLAAVQFTLIGQ